ncbi:hypothetical protein RYX36_004364 [Vicia faba]
MSAPEVAVNYYMGDDLYLFDEFQTSRVPNTRRPKIGITYGDECEHPKPHPEPYLKGLEALKASKDHTFVFEDSVSGIKAGVAAGMPVIGLSTRNPEHLLMGAKPTFLIKDYDDPKLWAALEELDKSGSH